MQKRQLLAFTITTALGTSVFATSSYVKAADLYENDQANLDMYGRIALALSGGGREYDDNGDRADELEFRDAYSRLGLHGDYQITPDVQLYANIEFRFDASEEDYGEGVNDVRESYIGVRSQKYGVLQAGNYDGMYKQSVIAPFSPYVDRGREFTSGDFQSLGDSIAYISPTMHNVTGFIQAKIYSANGTDAGSEHDSTQFNTQGGLAYENDIVRLAAGYAQDKEGLAGGIGENVYGATAVYKATPNFSPRFGYETQDTNQDRFGVGAKYVHGKFTFQGDYYFIDLDDGPTEANGGEDRKNPWVVGLYYNIMPNFDIFAEVVDSDQGPAIVGEGSNALVSEDSTHWISGARYFF